MSLETFWGLTLRELSWEFDAARLRIKWEQMRDKQLAWMTGYLSQPLKRFPRFSDWMRGEEKGSTSKDPQAMAQMKASLHAFAKRLGTKVTTQAERDAGAHGR